ncbi:hypothetical protein [Undibacterium sp.]|uniref:hypothetical protein n=1 Tax=Undibacterium sp. TaxID=1914977 RepID=UPI0025DDB1A8|nr:hypothetical protein [Undibacterium sp.]
MNKLFVISALSVLSFVASAQTATEVETVRISGEQSIVLPSETYAMRSDEFYKFKGSYSLSNGMSLSLFERGRSMFAQIDDQERHQIVATASNAFVAKDQQLKMRIDLKDNGEVGGELFYLAPTQASTEGQLPHQKLMVAVFR